MNNQQPKPSLWLEMANILLGPSGPNTLTTFGPQAADMIRAVRDKIAPERPEPIVDDWDSVMAGRIWQQWATANNIRERLTAEADKAEAGE